MTPEDACKFVMPFGKHRGKTLEEIATKDPDGARYLDWAVGLDIGPGCSLTVESQDAIWTFLEIPWVQEMVNRSLEVRESRDYSEPPENTQKPRQWWEK